MEAEEKICWKYQTKELSQFQQWQREPSVLNFLTSNWYVFKTGIYWKFRTACFLIICCFYCLGAPAWNWGDIL